MSRLLHVYLKDVLAGALEQTQDGTLQFSYDAAYLSANEPALSISLPLTPVAFVGRNVTSFFSGLLPDEGVRERLAKYLGVSQRNAFALLEQVGGDCAGALSLHHPGDSPPSPKNDMESLNAAQLKEILTLIKRQPLLAGEDGYRLSLAGAQDKLAVRFKDEKVCLVKAGGPTTHILKPVLDHVQDSAHNELFCMRLARLVGIPAPDVFLHHVEDIPYYIIERYDRMIQKDGTVMRLHQEDFCQALAIPPETKYEQEGGPSVAHCQEVIQKHTDTPGKHVLGFLDRLIFNYLIGNADAHGKNFSLLYHREKPSLAPAYDLLSTAVYPNLSSKMAMKIGGKYKPEEVYPRHWHRLVPDTKTAQAAFTKRRQFLAKKTLEQASQLKGALHSEGHTSPIFDAILGIIQERSKRVLD